MLNARDFLEEDTYKAWKHDYDNLMAYRKSLKGKPTEEERMVLDMNKQWIDFYKTVLFHVAGRERCDCKMCSDKREQQNKTAIVQRNAPRTPRIT